MTNLLRRIQTALHIAGCDNTEPTINNLIECYLNHVSTNEESKEEIRKAIADKQISVNDMCFALMSQK